MPFNAEDILAALHSRLSQTRFSHALQDPHSQLQRRVGDFSKLACLISTLSSRNQQERHDVPERKPSQSRAPLQFPPDGGIDAITRQSCCASRASPLLPPNAVISYRRQARQTSHSDKYYGPAPNKPLQCRNTTCMDRGDLHCLASGVLARRVRSPCAYTPECAGEATWLLTKLASSTAALLFAWLLLSACTSPVAFQ